MMPPLIHRVNVLLLLLATIWFCPEVASQEDVFDENAIEPFPFPSLRPSTRTTPSAAPLNSNSTAIPTNITVMGTNNPSSDSPSLAPCDPDDYARVSRATIGSAIGFLYFAIIYVASCVKNLCRDLPNIFLILLSAISVGLAAAYSGREATDEEICEGDSEGAYVTDSLVGVVVLLMGVVELIFELVCCDGKRAFRQDNFAQTRLLGPFDEGDPRDWRWWTVSCTALFLGTLGAAAVVLDSIAAGYDWWVSLCFSLWEALALAFCFSAAFSVGGCFEGWSRGGVWAFVKWLLVDGPGIVGVAAGLPGEFPPLVAQAVVEMVLYCAEKGGESD